MRHEKQNDSELVDTVNEHIDKARRGAWIWMDEGVNKPLKEVYLPEFNRLSESAMQSLERNLLKNQMIKADRREACIRDIEGFLQSMRKWIKRYIESGLNDIKSWPSSKTIVICSILNYDALQRREIKLAFIYQYLLIPKFFEQLADGLRWFVEGEEEVEERGGTNTNPLD